MKKRVIILSKREPPVQNRGVETYDGLQLRLAHSLLCYLYVIHQSKLKLIVKVSYLVYFFLSQYLFKATPTAKHSLISVP